MAKPTARIALSTFTLLLLLAACGDTLPPAGGGGQAVQSGCGAGSALIVLGDGYIENLCGCAEEAGTRVVAPDTFTCTVETGTVVIFDATATDLEHQVHFTVTPAPAAGSPILGGRSATGTVRHAVAVDLAGTYEFSDLFQNGIPGRIVVQ